MDSKEAMLWTPAQDQKAQCFLCAHRCLISPGQWGLCRVRRNVGGKLLSLNYGLLVAMNIDPIEKKPLFHFLPGTQTLSIAAAGCNFQCDFCQNWQISQSPRQGDIEGIPTTPQEVVQAAIQSNCPSISYTYTEPTIYFETAYECAILARRQSLRNVFVSNGYMTVEAVEAIAPYLDAINVDLKAFNDNTYRRVMKARLAPVLDCLKALAGKGIWLEVTTLIVPGMNDSPGELADIAAFIARELGAHVPWHVTRFHGDYRMNGTPSTPLETLRRSADIGLEAGLTYVYCGNISGLADESTYCPACRETLIDRRGYDISGIRLNNGKCPNCDRAIEGIWSP